MFAWLARLIRQSLLCMFCVLVACTSATAVTLQEKVREFDLDNGMKFLVVERHEAPVVFCAIVFNVGSANEWPNVTGISHLIEHMLFKGTQMIGTTDYEKEIPYIKKTDALGERTIVLRHAMGEWRFERFKDFYQDVLDTFTDEERERIGADKHAQNALFIEKARALGALPDSLMSVRYLVEDQGHNYFELYLEYEEAWGEIVRLTDEQRKLLVVNELWETYMNNGSRLLNAGTAQDLTVYFVYLPVNRLELWATMESDRMDSPVFREFWIERDVVMEERRLADNDPNSVLTETFYSTAFAACPYKWDVLGWMSDLRTIDRRELAAYHEKYYAPNTATAVIVGDVDLDHVKKLAQKYFGPLPAQDPPAPIETREPEQQGEKRLTVKHIAEPKVMIGWHKPTTPDPEAITFDVMEQILAGARTSRLYKSIYETKQLTAQPPSCYTGPAERYDNLMVIEAEPRAPHTLDELENAIYEEIEKLKSEPVSDRELERIKNQIDAQRIRQLGSNLGIAFQLIIGQAFYGDWRESFRIQEMYKEVTSEDIMAVAKKYLTQKNRTVAYRVKEEEKASPAGGNEALSQAEMQRILMQYVQSLPTDEQAAIMQRFQSMRSEAEAMEYAKELLQRAKDAGFVKP